MNKLCLYGAAMLSQAVGGRNADGLLKLPEENFQWTGFLA